MQNISVIVPVYNGEKYVEKCVERLISEKDFLHEIIIVNDGSKDNTEELLRRYEMDEKILIINQDNKGVSAARNCGIRACTGEWVVFCDVDDEINDGFFCDIINSLEDGLGADLICYAKGEIGSDESGVCVRNFDKKKAFLLSLGCDVDNLLNDYIFMSVWSKVFKRDILVANRIEFNEKISYAEDVLFLLQYLLKTRTINLIHRGYYLYLPNEEGACMRGGSIRDYEGFFEFDENFWKIVNSDESLMHDDKIKSVEEDYLFNIARIMCGRVVRGTKSFPLEERSKMVKNICDRTKSYYKKASVKVKFAFWFKRYFTWLYIVANRR